jgi:hypothetical protein
MDRAELLRDKNTTALISRFLSGEIKWLEPVYDSKIGYTYPPVEAMVGDSVRAEDFLNKLYRADILERRLYDKVIHCATCGSANISVRYCCPYCKSFDIKKSSLIEHVKCGYMDVQQNFSKEDKLVCPKCGEELKKPDLDYRKAGVWCSCTECSKSFDIPVTAHFCRNCHSDFTFEDAVTTNVYSYSLKEKAAEEASLGLIIIGPIKDYLTENGFDTESPAFLKGKSGANHIFDIAVRKGKNTESVTVIDVASSSENPVSEQPVIALFAKIFDVSPEKAFLIAIPSLNDNGKKMADLYNISVIEAKNQKDAMKSVRERILSGNKE